METEREFTTADLANPDRGSRGQDTEQPKDSKLPTDRGTADLAVDDPASASLFPPAEADRFRDQWVQTQGQFVDQPREAVEQADHLVADLMQKLATQFSETRADLERRWDGQEDVSTEDLRVAMTQYRSFFERLLEA
jgi:hypothetical protein